MTHAAEIASQFRELFEGRWIAATNFKEQLADISWQQAVMQVSEANSIALLTFHVNYYVGGVIGLLEHGTLDIQDKFSFDLPPIKSQADWERLKNNMFDNADTFARLIETLSEEKLNASFVDEKYGSYRKNLHAIIEHCYYHLGQIVLIKKLLKEG